MKKLLLILGLIPSFVISQDTTKLKDVQVIGIKQDAHEPVSNTIINGATISMLNQQKDPFILLSQASPAIYSQSDNGSGNGYCYMRLRGLDQTRINYNLNGIPLNEMEDQGLYFSNMPGFSNYLSSINVQRGIGTSKYGNTSIAGSINMETIDMSTKIFDKSLIIFNDIPIFNNQNNTLYNGMYSSGFSKGLSFQLGGTYLINQGFKDHSGNDGGSIFYGVGISKRKNIYKIYGFNGVAHNQLAFYGVPMSIIDSNYKMNLNLQSDKDTFNQNFITANWINQSLNRIKFNTSIYYISVNGHYSTGGVLFGVNSHQYGIMSNMVYKNQNNIINIGVNSNIYNRNHFGSDSSGYYPIFITNNNLYSNTGYKEDVATYIKYTKIVNNFNFFLDIQERDVWFHVTDGSTNYLKNNWIFFNPKIGIKYLKPVNDWYISFGNTKREPTRTDMVQNIVQTNNLSGANTDNISLVPINTLKLNPESVYDLEIGNNYHNKLLLFNFNIYLMNIKNEYVSTGIIDPYSGFMQKKVFNSTIRCGIESDGKYSFPQHTLWRFNIFYNYQMQYNKLDSSSTRIPFCPNFTENTGISYSSRYGITVGISNQYVSKMKMDLSNKYTSEAYCILNTFINYKFDRKTSISFKVNNIFDSKYYIPAGINVGPTIPTYYVGQLINWNLTIKSLL